MNNDWKNNQNKNQRKIVNLFKKDRFYVILFVCLCIVAGIAAYTNLKPKHKAVSVSETGKRLSKVDEASKDAVKTSKVNNNATTKDQMENAEQVNRSENLKKKDDNPAVSTVSNNVVKQPFVIPVQNGNVVVKFDTWYSKNGKYTSIPGEYIKPNQSTNVTAAMDGIVSSVNGGKVTVLNNEKGYMTVYDNLDEKSIAVKPNTAIKQGQLIGKIGDSNYSNKLITDTSCAYFEIDQKQSDGSYVAVDPEKMISEK